MTEETPDNKDDRHPHRAGDLPWDVVSPTDLVEYWTADGGHHLQVAAKAPWGVVAVGEAAVEFFRAWRPEKVERVLSMSGPHSTACFFTTTRSWDAFALYMERIGDDDLYGVRFRHPECGDLILTKDGVAPYEEPKREPSMLDNVTVIGISAEQLPLNAALLDRILSATPRATDEMMTAGVAAANAHPFDADGMIGRVQVRAIWDTMAALMPGLSIVGFEALKQALNKRNDDLLAANTRYQEAARQAKAERDEARQDAGNAERENMELRRTIIRMYVAVMRKECPLPDHAQAEHLDELTNPVRERVTELMQLVVAPPPTTKQLHAAIEAFASAAEPFLSWGRGLSPEWSPSRLRSSLSFSDDTVDITVGHCRRLVETHNALLTQLAVPLDLKWIRRDDLTTEDAVRLAGQQVYIRTENGIWRTRNKRGGGNGYTSNPAEADTWTFIEAYDQTAHCGPEKETAFGYRAKL